MGGNKGVKVGALIAAEDKRKHLEFVQSAIGRMATASAVVKGWALTLAVAAYGYAATQDSLSVVLLGILAVLLFAGVDARYLREERRYRLLFEGVRTGSVDGYEMRAGPYCASLDRSQQRHYSWPRVISSWSVRDYYGAMVLAGVVILVWLICRR